MGSFSFKATLRALRYRNYRLFFGGQIISLTGTWMQQVAMSWLVYRLSGSAFILGLVGFASQIPTFIMAPFAGVFIDRWKKHRIIVYTQTFSMIQAFILVALIYFESIQIWHIILLNTILGIINGFDMPTRQAFVVEMVENKEDLGNAIALNSLMFNSARLIGPAMAGILISAFGEEICFLFNGISYIAVIIALLAMKISFTKPAHAKKHVLQGLKEGFKYAFEFTPIKYLLMLIGIVSLMGMPYVVLMPVFAKEILGGGAHTLGFLIGAIGIGALIGAFLLAARKSVVGLDKIIFFATLTFGAVLILFSFSRSLPLSLFLLFFAGFSMMTQMASSNTIIQTIVDDDKRGRVMSFYTMAFVGTMPLGSLFAGSVAEIIGTPNTILIGGAFCIIASLFFRHKLPFIGQMMRPVYTKMGIIPEVATGLQASTNLRTPPQN